MQTAPADPADVLLALQSFNREPFREILSVAIGEAPTPKAIKKFADKSPDRYAQFIAIFAKLAGYNDKLEVDVKGLLAVAHLSDAELMDRRDKMLADMQLSTALIDDKANNTK